ncbi:formate/nitrite transporter family protein [Saliphagus infecundisoli]|uniref:Formate/nitrite transporter family protein n=1 Tax=Saliphagus infecundisoli TaxID=1849069 RepID=A0ABD5Q918_9EURY|nr:formate/nitrite transporter family protein [Saliphagus infecundisoli]
MSTVEPPSLTLPAGERDHSRGPADAPVTLVQYGDFECPHCGDIYPVIRRIQNRVGTRLRLIFRHFPLTQQHPHAQQAAEAAEAAGAQGDAEFWRMHDRLYEHQNALTDEDLEEHAEVLGLDTGRFVQELNEGVHEDRVDEDRLSGARSGVNGTPTLFINGERYDGPLEFESLLTAIAEAGDLVDIQRSMDLDNRELRETIDRSRRGAPAAGAAVRDQFSADEIFQRVTATADEDIDRSVRLLFFSGLAAGLSLGATFFGRAVMTTAYPNDPIGLGNIFYPLGFIFIVLGGYQLYTENTLTPVTLVLTRLASIPRLLRLWGIVAVANVAGVTIIALLFARTGIFNAAVAETARGFGEHALSISWSALFFRAMIAGGLVATMVWLTHAAREATARFLIVYMIMFLIPAGDLFHCITGACEVLYLAFVGGTDLVTAFVDFFIPVVLGNTIGGIAFVALVNYSMTAERRFSDRDRLQRELDWSEWLLGSYADRLLSEREGESGPTKSD